MARRREQTPDERLTNVHAKDSHIKWKICVYIRLSREDTRNAEGQDKSERQIRSESIRNQESILKTWIEEYFKDEDYEIAGFFSDDGLTGTDDTREAFMAMLRTLEKGQGNCVVCKALSRAFRNYSDQGYYLEEYFPSRNIRFISTMDSFVDSYTQPEAVYALDVPMYGVMNDRYAGATSRAVRRTFDDKRAKGKFIGAFPPWGFLKDPKDKNHLILDPDTAPIKVQMKDWVLREGMSLNGVARRLNAMGVPNPTKYKRMKGWKYRNPHTEDNDGLWCGKTVRGVLLNLMNAGHMVQGRQKVVSYKIHDKISVPKEEWFIVENTHEAAFSQEDYDALCDLLGRKMRTADHSNTVHMFAGLIRCGRCGKAMYRSHGKGCVYFKCRTRREKAADACPVRSIRQDKLELAVLAALRMQISLLDLPGNLPEQISRDTADDTPSKRFQMLLEDREKELRRMQRLYDGLYEDWKSGELTEAEYRRMREHYKMEILRTEREAEKIKEESDCLREKECGENLLLEEFMKHRNLTRLDRSALLSFVDAVYVYENNEITISFRFEDELLKISQSVLS